MKPVVVLTRRWPEPVERILTEEFDTRLNRTDEPMTAKALREALMACDALCPTVTDRIDGTLLKGMEPRARILANFGVGTDHVDLSAADRAGLAVTNTPGVLTDATADLAMTLLLMAARRAGEGERELRAGHWAGWRPTHLIGHDVTGATLGIVGAGRIGLAMAARARFGFSMKILLHSRSPVDPDRVDSLGAESCSLEDLLGRSDFVSLHCPSTHQTRGLINRDRLALMPSHAILINTARGDVVDETALAEALARRAIAAAGLDVYAGEPQVPTALKALENVVLLPHLGSATERTRNAMGMRVIENLRAFFSGAPVLDPVVAP